MCSANEVEGAPPRLFLMVIDNRSGCQLPSVCNALRVFDSQSCDRHLWALHVCASLRRDCYVRLLPDHDRVSEACVPWRSGRFELDGHILP